MKEQQQKKARLLRSQGLSINEIYQELGVAKSSVSLWVRNIVLSTEQKQRLSVKGIKTEVIEQRRSTRLHKENTRRNIVIEKAFKQINRLQLQELQYIGAALYWAEGGKTQRLVRFANSDPRMIKLMMRFFRKVCQVPQNKFRAYLHIHPHLDYKKAEIYWSKITNIPLKQFFKTYRIPNSSSKNKKDTLPYGTLDIYVCNTELFLTIQGWIKGIYTQFIPKTFLTSYTK